MGVVGKEVIPIVHVYIHVSNYTGFSNKSIIYFIPDACGRGRLDSSSWEKENRKPSSS